MRNTAANYNTKPDPNPSPSHDRNPNSNPNPIAIQHLYSHSAFYHTPVYTNPQFKIQPTVAI